MRARTLTFALLVLSSCSPDAAERAAIAEAGVTPEAVGRSRVAFQAAMDALDAGDAASYLQHVRQAADLRPQHPTLIYHVARAFALVDSTERALTELSRLAAMGIAARPSGDSVFVALGGEAEFRLLLARFESHTEPVGASDLAFSVPYPDFLPEGLAYDPVRRSFFLGSVHRREIVRVTEDSVASFLTSRQAPLWGAMGMAVDAPRRRLYVATSAVEEAEGYDSAAAGKAAVLMVDIDSGDLLEVYEAQGDSGPHLIGDLSVGPAGDVYVSDSRGAAVLRIGVTGSGMVPVNAGGEFVSPQGIAVSEDGEHIYLADYSLGLFRIDAANGSTLWLPYPEDQTLLGIDGLYRCGGRLVGIQNGIAPNRLIALRLDEEGTRVVEVDVLVANHPLFAEPTLGTVVGDTLYYVANSQWGLFAGDASVEERQPPRILKLACPS